MVTPVTARASPSFWSGTISAAAMHPSAMTPMGMCGFILWFSFVLGSVTLVRGGDCQPDYLGGFLIDDTL